MMRDNIRNSGFLDSTKLSLIFLKTDILEAHQDQLDWIFEEFEIFFLEEQHYDEVLRETYAKHFAGYFEKLSLEKNKFLQEMAHLGLNLIYAEYPELGPSMRSHSMD